MLPVFYQILFFPLYCRGSPFKGSGFWLPSNWAPLPIHQLPKFYPKTLFIVFGVKFSPGNATLQENNNNNNNKRIHRKKIQRIEFWHQPSELLSSKYKIKKRRIIKWQITSYDTLLYPNFQVDTQIYFPPSLPLLCFPFLSIYITQVLSNVVSLILFYFFFL